MSSAWFTRLPVLIVLGVALVACDSDTGDTADAGGTASLTRVEDLPPEARVVQPAAGDVTGEDADTFVALLSFEPLYPSEVPEGFELAAAVIHPSPFEEMTDLRLVYEHVSDQNTWIQIVQSRQGMPAGITPGTPEPIEIGGEEGVITRFPGIPGGEAFHLFWPACGLTIRVETPALEADESAQMQESAIRMLESIECPSES